MKRIYSQPLFWRLGAGDRISLDLEGALDYYTSYRGVGCDGVLNGLLVQSPGEGDPTGPLHLAVEGSEDGPVIVVRDCANEVVTTAGGAGGGEEGLVYRATIQGADGSIVGTSVGANTLGGTLVWAYSSEGVYTATLAGVFGGVITTMLVTIGSATGGVIAKMVRTNSNVLTLSTFDVDGTTPADFIGTISVVVFVDAPAS